MKKLTIILNGGLKSCCSLYPSEMVKEIVGEWTEGMCNLEVVDTKERKWNPDELASMAIKYFGEYAYPFIYIDDVLISIGYFPTQEELLELLLREEVKGVDKQDIIEAAKKYDFVKEGENV